MLAEDKHTAKPENDGYQRRAQELRNGVGEVVTAVDTVEGAACVIDEVGKARAQFVFRVEGFHHAQSSQRLLYLSQDFCVLLLTMLRCTLERAPHATYQPSRHGQQQ